MRTKKYMGFIVISFLLLSCGSDEKKDKETPIMSNVKSAEKKLVISTMLEVAYYGKPELIQRYLDHNHTIDQIDSRSNSTPIYFAIQANQVATVQAFLDYSANIEHRNNLGQTPLHVAVAQGRNEIVNVLLKNEANLEAKDNNGVTPLIYAIENSRTILARQFVEKGAKLDGNNRFQVTPVHMAIQHHNIKLLELL